MVLPTNRQDDNLAFIAMSTHPLAANLPDTVYALAPSLFQTLCMLWHLQAPSLRQVMVMFISGYPPRSSVESTGGVIDRITSY
jgi:hypothetical protein